MCDGTIPTLDAEDSMFSPQQYFQVEKRKIPVGEPLPARVTTVTIVLGQSETVSWEEAVKNNH